LPQTNSIYSEIHLITATADGKCATAIEVLSGNKTVEGLIISQPSRSLKSSRMREESRENQRGNAASKNQTPIAILNSYHGFLLVNACHEGWHSAFKSESLGGCLISPGLRVGVLL